MNQGFSNEQVYDAISGAANNFFNNLTGSVYWRVQQNELALGNYNMSGIQINFRVREFMKPDGTPVLPQSQINPQWLSAGSYFGIVDVDIPNENGFSIQAPHNKTENFMHLQKGKNKIIIPPNSENITDYGKLVSGLSLKFCTREEAISYINQIRNS